MSTISLPVAIAIVIWAAIAVLDIYLHVDNYLERREARRRNQAHPYGRNRR